MSNGSFTVSGVQFVPGTGGTQALGPIVVDFSDQIATQVVTANPTATVAPVTNGVWIIPGGTESDTLSVTTNNANVPFAISPIVPTLLSLDPGNPPEGIYLAASSGFPITIQWV